ncbi:hypothetical protein ABBQ32_004403 [Trebouxia sp. C0010 RCD-2024]
MVPTAKTRGVLGHSPTLWWRSRYPAAHYMPQHTVGQCMTPQQCIFWCCLAVIWDALKAACESDLQTAQLVVNTAGVIVTVPDLSTCFDERGSKYELPRYVLSEPSNLISERDSKHQTQQQVELTARRM